MYFSPSHQAMTFLVGVASANLDYIEASPQLKMQIEVLAQYDGFPITRIHDAHIPPIF